MLSSQQYVGRENMINKVCTALRSGNHVFIYGPFGIGKTSSALAAVRAMARPRYDLQRLSIDDCRTFF